MAIFNLQKDLKFDREHFETLYGKTYEEFIESYSDNVIIDLTGKVVVCIESTWRYPEQARFPADILAILIPEGKKYKYKATLIYSCHIAFIKLEYENGTIKYFYKDDECYPQTYDEFCENDADVFCQCEENGFKKEDVLKQIEMTIKVNYDFGYELDKDSLIILNGL